MTGTDAPTTSATAAARTYPDYGRPLWQRWLLTRESAVIAALVVVAVVAAQPDKANVPAHRHREMIGGFVGLEDFMLQLKVGGAGHAQAKDRLCRMAVVLLKVRHLGGLAIPFPRPDGLALFSNPA